MRGVELPKSSPLLWPTAAPADGGDTAAIDLPGLNKGAKNDELTLAVGVSAKSEMVIDIERSSSRSCCRSSSDSIVAFS